MVTVFKDSLRFFLYSILLLLWLLMCVKDASAQKEDKLTMLRAPMSINIDGKLTEWGDSLAMFDKTTKLNYSIACNDTDLYVAISATDRQAIRKIMAAGITISVNPDGKKHKNNGITYPMPAVRSLSSFGRMREDDTSDFHPKTSLLNSTSIGISGYKDVESDVITTANTYGFKAALGFDEHHNLVYEIAIPLKFLYIKPKTAEVAINISVNGIERPQNQTRGEGGNRELGGTGGEGMGMGGMGGGRGGRGGGGGRGGSRGGNSNQNSQDKQGMSQATDFWVKMALAK